MAALDIIRNVFSDGFVKNKNHGICRPRNCRPQHGFQERNRCNDDRRSSCVSTIWQTDSTVKDWLSVHKERMNTGKSVRPDLPYDYLLEVDLGEVKPMIALPFHPSNAYTIEEVNENPEDILRLTEENCNAQMKNSA